MHPAAAFRHDDPAALDALAHGIGFASIFAQGTDGPAVAHTPVLFGGDERLHFHIARSNALAKTLAGQRALIVLNGPEAYISARWYAERDQVPTWNYVALEYDGTVEAMPDADLPALLTALSEREEARLSHGIPWTMDKVSDAALNALLRGIVGFSMRVTERRETVKLSQNKSADERARLIAGLRAENATAPRADMAQLMKDGVARLGASNGGAA